jgi:uncharacterized repeat protein (TIGR04138 family)
MAIMETKLLEVAAKDPRYAYEAYEFIFKAMDHAQAKLGHNRSGDQRRSGDADDEAAAPHLKSRELLEGIRSLALLEFGLMARTVFQMWGVRSTLDFGQIIFNLVEADLITKTDDETPADFRDVFDFDEALVQGYTIPLDEAR